SGSYGDYTEPHDAMLIPARLEEVDLDLYLQFDTGAPSTMLYGNSLESLMEQGLVVEILQEGDNRFVRELTMTLGGSEVRMEMIRILDGYGGDISQEESSKIGTIGADFLLPYLTEINFRDRVIQQYLSRESWMTDQQSFESFEFAGRRLMLPCVLDGKELSLFYDSGSSAFGLITTPGRYERYSLNDGPEIAYSTNSWGNQLSIQHKETAYAMVMNDQSIPLRRVSYVNMYAGLQGLMTPFTSIGGWLGNKPFLGYSLILDVAKEEFVIVFP
ncbi:MAG: hypothetical protein AAGM67_18800, partial [Bacteroidota bacterium]